MLRPSTLTAFGAPSGTSFRLATLTKLDSWFDIRHIPSLFKHIHRGLAFREAQGCVCGGPAVFVRADVRSISSQAYEELVSSGMSGAEGRIRSAAAFPFF